MEREIAVVSGRQLRLIAIDQLRYAGLSASGARSRVARGRLFRVRPRVYATHPPPYSREQRWMAAVLAGGSGALLSDWPASIHLEIAPDGASALPHITIPPARRRSLPGVVVHRRQVEARDRRVVGQIPITAPELVVVHLSPALSEPELGRMLVAAESKRMLNRRRLEELVAERAGRPGVGKLLPLLDRPRSIAKSELELLMVPVLHEAGVPWPLFNHPIRVPERRRPLIVDLYWPELRLVVELDSQRWHGDWEHSEDDRERDQLLALAELAPHRFFRRQVKREPAVAARRLRGIVELRARELAQQRASRAASRRMDDAA